METNKDRSSELLLTLLDEEGGDSKGPFLLSWDPSTIAPPLPDLHCLPLSPWGFAWRGSLLRYASVCRGDHCRIRTGGLKAGLLIHGKGVGGAGKGPRELSIALFSCVQFWGSSLRTEGTVHGALRAEHRG